MNLDINLSRILRWCECPDESEMEKHFSIVLILRADGRILMSVVARINCPSGILWTVPFTGTLGRKHLRGEHLICWNVIRLNLKANQVDGTAMFIDLGLKASEFYFRKIWKSDLLNNIKKLER